MAIQPLRASAVNTARAKSARASPQPAFPGLGSTLVSERPRPRTLTPVPSPAPSHPPHRERGTRLKLSCFPSLGSLLSFRSFLGCSPSSPGVGGGRGREKRVGVMRVLGGGEAILAIPTI